MDWWTIKRIVGLPNYTMETNEQNALLFVFQFWSCNSIGGRGCPQSEVYDDDHNDEDLARNLDEERRENALIHMSSY